MRSEIARSTSGGFQARGIAGTRAILLAMDCSPKRLQGLRGFAIWRETKGRPTSGRWLRSFKVFKSVVPDPKPATGKNAPRYSTEDHPIQSFLWSDYTAAPDTTYLFRIIPKYGTSGSLSDDDADSLKVEVRTEAEEVVDGHGVWFNRGAIASQAFSREFGDVSPAEYVDDVDAPVTKWLSRGLAEACIAFIDGVPKGDELVGCVYEFTYQPVLIAIKAAIKRGVRVQLSYHETDVNSSAIATAKLPRTSKGKQVLFPRTKPKIPHNKFFVHVRKAVPHAVWTGSTNITPSGFLGQSNVGHVVEDGHVAQAYYDYFEALSLDPTLAKARDAVVALSPHPPELVASSPLPVVFSPRRTSNMLDWYGNRIEDAAEGVMFTGAFGINARLLPRLTKNRSFLRFVMLEKRPSAAESAQLRSDRDLVVAYGAELGKTSIYKNKKFQKVRIKNFSLDKWFAREEHYRKQGNIFFIHTKILLIDPLSEDPLVCTGSANYSKNSLESNDENMLLIRGVPRIADIYLTEFDRLFRHFYFRDVANEIEAKGGDATGAFLDERDSGVDVWTKSYFRKGAFKTRRREMFFATAKRKWTAASGRRKKFETSDEA
ncbi:phospholipase D-like domain-containing protein [Gemmatimonas sp.]|uniref:phospholipase D-like domain-containing protein n=1 Tax=Gemmatimonas sp. TaxID=1962908 RepID=UPI00286E42AC|nr:phospholipase D-like domain-containing protein [Gemmatimonas sp.]